MPTTTRDAAIAASCGKHHAAWVQQHFTREEIRLEDAINCSQRKRARLCSGASQSGSDHPPATEAVAFFSLGRKCDSARSAGGVARMLTVRNAAYLRQSGRGFSPVTSAGGTSPRHERRRLRFLKIGGDSLELARRVLHAADVPPPSRSRPAQDNREKLLVLPYTGPIGTSVLDNDRRGTMRVRALGFFLAVMVTSGCLAWAADAVAGCGDVTNDRNVSAGDALSVLRAAVGQNVNLQCTYEDVLLDPLEAPESGEVGLASGFAPDPYSKSIVALGSVSTPYLGTECTGVTGVAPDFTVHFVAGASPLLRFFWIPGNGVDSMMIVNDPAGNYSCNNDSFGTAYPTVDFMNPKSGSYRVWIGHFAYTDITGTLLVTESAAKHP
jgi:hypothetical protein